MLCMDMQDTQRSFWRAASFGFDTIPRMCGVRKTQRRSLHRNRHSSYILSIYFNVDFFYKIHYGHIWMVDVGASGSGSF
jgi:hypothetical protein